MSNPSIRRQFLVPLILAVFLVASLVTIATWFAVHLSTRSSVYHRLSNLGSLFVQTPYPLTENVLRQIVLLSNAELAVLDRDRHVLFASNRKMSEVSRVQLESLQQGALNTIQVADTPFDAILRELPHSNPLGTHADVTDRYLLVMQDQRQRRQSAWQALVLPIITGLGSIVGTALVATFLATRIGRRIEKLETQVNGLRKEDFKY